MKPLIIALFLSVCSALFAQDRIQFGDRQVEQDVFVNLFNKSYEIKKDGKSERKYLTITLEQAKELNSKRAQSKNVEVPFGAVTLILYSKDQINTL